MGGVAATRNAQDDKMSADYQARRRPGEWAADVIQWGPARNSVKRGVHLAAHFRSSALQLTGRVPHIANIFAASPPKAGSQWMKAILDHSVVRTHNRLWTLPQLDYQRRSDRTFPLGTSVPGLYLAYDEYLRINKPAEYRTLYMFRDPREIVVSAYFSIMKTHRPLPALSAAREALASAPVETGLLRTIEIMAPHLRSMATWAAVDEPQVATFRLEMIAADPSAQVERILDHCGVQLSYPELERVLRDTSRTSLQVRDLVRRSAGEESHYRLDQLGHRELFTDEHLEALDAAAPGLVALLGYDAGT